MDVKLGLKQKIFLVILFVAFIPTVFLIYVTYKTFDQSYTQLLEQQYSQVVDRVSNQLAGYDDEALARKQLNTVLSQLPLLEKGYFVIWDRDGEIVYEQVQSRSWLAQSIAANLDKLQFEQELSAYGWTVSLTVDKVSAQSTLYELRGLLILQVLIISIVVVLVASRLARSITNPLLDVMEQMERMERGELKVNIAVESSDEVGVLAYRFNKMAGRLREYIDRYYVAKLRQRDAELTALKAQIDPHYLNNTLEVIRMTAIGEGAETAAKMIELLSHQMRYTINADCELVALQSELDFIRSYIQLLNYRYPAKIGLTVVENHLGDRVIPRLSIQPLVENAYKHGIRPKNTPGLIEIAVEETEDALEITVMDNGQGITPDRLNELNEKLEREKLDGPREESAHSIGLCNVNERIRRLYGEEYGLTISSSVGLGTAVCIRLPKQEEEDHNVDHGFGGR